MAFLCDNRGYYLGWRGAYIGCHRSGSSPFLGCGGEWRPCRSLNGNDDADRTKQARNGTINSVPCGHLVRLERYLGDVSSHNRFLRLYAVRSEEHTSELQSLMRISYAVFCLKKKKNNKNTKKTQI